MTSVYSSSANAQVQTPVLPYLVRRLDGDAAQGYATLVTVFGVVQLAGGLLAGPLSDRFGARGVFLMSFVASGLCYAITASATGMLGLYASRLPTVMQHAVLAARALVAERTSDRDRARWLGYVGAAYAVGMALGPASGGALGARSLALAAWASAAASVLSALSVLAFLPAAGAGDAEAKAAKGAPAAKAPLLAAFVRVWAAPNVPSLLLAKLISSAPAAVFRAVWPLVAMEHVGLDVQQQGLFLSAMGAAACFAQSVLVAFADRFDDRLVACTCSLVLALGFCGMALATGAAQLLAAVVPISMAGAVLQNLQTAKLTRAAAPAEVGTVIASDMSLGSFLGIVAPGMGASLLAAGGVPALAGAAATAYVALAALVGVRVLAA